MTFAAITGWGACMPPAVLTNADLATFLDTNDEWIVTRTGMRERRISHASAIEMATAARPSSCRRPNARKACSASSSAATRTRASKAVLERCGVSPDQVDLVVPHQANLRIIEAVVSRTGIPMKKVMLTVERYGNMSAATVPVALTEAIGEGRVQPGALVLMPAFGAGLTFCAHLVRWGGRITPVARSSADLPACGTTALELVNRIRAKKRGAWERSGSGLNAPSLVEVA